MGAIGGLTGAGSLTAGAGGVVEKVGAGAGGGVAARPPPRVSAGIASPGFQTGASIGVQAGLAGSIGFAGSSTGLSGAAAGGGEVTNAPPPISNGDGGELGASGAAGAGSGGLDALAGSGDWTKGGSDRGGASDQVGTAGVLTLGSAGAAASAGGAAEAAGVGGNVTAGIAG